MIFLTLLPVLVFVVYAWADWRFQRGTNAAISALLAGVPSTPASIVTSASLAPLPAPVRRWLEVSGVVGKPRPRTVRLRQRGLMRSAPEQISRPVTAEQYFNLDTPGFVWRVRRWMMLLIPVVGRDSYSGGKGRSLSKAAALVSVSDEANEKIDQGTLLRFLGEIVWFPSEALHPAIHWTHIDNSSSRATMTWGEVTGSAVFQFDEHGRFFRLSAERYMSADADAKPKHWAFRATTWQRMDGIIIPTKGKVAWQLKAGDFIYYTCEITELEYDLPALYP
jgi:hypothetical protein